MAGIAGGLLVLWLAPQAPQAVENIQSALPLAENRPLQTEVSQDTAQKIHDELLKRARQQKGVQSV